MQTIKNKAFRVSIQWNALVRKLLALARGGFTKSFYSTCIPLCYRVIRICSVLIIITTQKP
ncbi:hypothetical protein C2S19_03205 [Helicobacter pylori]|nr:hypothetical protein C2S19_03205 [Helicobacter pylori]